MNLSSMPPSTPPTAPSQASATAPSAWLRSRYWTTASFVATALGGALLLGNAHHLHGGLMLLAAGVLLRQSLLGRRARRQAAIVNMRRAYEGTAH
ncbi:MAG: hypothetical protein WAP57_05540 [Aquabacterium commune]|uniref:hypothetical protein n=2 Tax=Burkholderiales genera incertae sedis TaxID=224471 RepID=UPI001DB96ACD|nr:hypothetical protein [Aquabacterium sp.]MBT9611197.1 hypothetical protein [Aquabacterium sp.]|tara:strand:+ start:1944 stop:2228 length:285 start_codon:yes stop_codon:yes gene_type:complete